MPAPAHPPRTIVITGASKGLGRALALAYAAPGRRLVLIARTLPPLQDVANTCEAKGARVLHGSIDVTDGAAMRGFIAEVEAEGPIDLLLVNAGQFWGNGAGGELEPMSRAVALLRTNLEGAILTVDAALPGMRRRRGGRIALVCSLAGLHALADAPTYSASKAGLAAYGEALRELLAPDGVQVTLIYPGYVETAQTACHVGVMPMMMSPDEAARIIARGISKGRDIVAFPWTLLWLIRLGWLLPWRLRALVSQHLRFHVGGGNGVAN
jgi:short-subunit dehydrogenase